MSLRNLSTYRKKRDFEKTDEPSGDVRVAPAKRRRFVIQKHAATHLHYDLRLEFDGVFKSWAVTRGPSLDPHDKRLAVEVEDHPLDYGDFEGTIPKGQYGGGTVQLWDRGYWDCGDPERGFKKGDLKFTLHGDKLHGSWVLVRMRHDRNGGKRTNWLLIKHRDEFARNRRGQRHPRRGSVRRVRPVDGRDHARQGPGTKTVHGGEGQPGQGGRGLALQPRRGGAGAHQGQGGGRRQKRNKSRKCRISSHHNFAPRSIVRRVARDGVMRSNSTAIACNCGSRAATPR